MISKWSGWAGWMVAAALACLAASGSGAADDLTAFRPPAPGTVFTYETKSRTYMGVLYGRHAYGTYANRFKVTVLRDHSPYRGIAVFRLSRQTKYKQRSKPARVSTQISVRRLADGNEIASLTPSGTFAMEFAPHDGYLAWPLSVGKTWSVKVVRKAVPKGAPSTLEAHYRVEAIEDLRTRAGTFKTVRIAWRKVKSKGPFKETVGKTWYVPSLGVAALITTGREGVRLGLHETTSQTELVSVKRP